MRAEPKRSSRRQAREKGRDAFFHGVILDCRPGAQGRDRYLDLVAELSGCRSGSSRCTVSMSIFLLLLSTLAGAAVYTAHQQSSTVTAAAKSHEPSASTTVPTAFIEEEHDFHHDTFRTTLQTLSGAIQEILREDDQASSQSNHLELGQKSASRQTATVSEQRSDAPSRGSELVMAAKPSMSTLELCKQLVGDFMYGVAQFILVFWFTVGELANSVWEARSTIAEYTATWYAPLHVQRVFVACGPRRLQASDREPDQGAKTGFGRRSIGGWVLPFVQAATGLFIATGWLISMMHGGHREPGPRQHAHVGDAGPPYVGTATLKVPPAWSVERSQSYSLRSWISDLILWSSATDLEVHRLGPIAALQVSGSAKELVRELTPEQLANGFHDPQTGQHITGLMLLVRTLAQRYAPLEQEAQTKAVSEFLAFARLPGETVDAFLVRFDVLRNRAAMRGGLGMNPAGLSWLLIRALGLPPDLLDRLLAPLGGQLPQNDAQLLELMQRVRRQGHLYEQGYRHSNRQGASGDPGAYFFPVMQNPAQGNAYVGAEVSSSMPYAPNVAGPSASAFDSQSMSAGVRDMIGGVEGSSFLHSAHYDFQCHSCGMFFADEDLSSATSSDEGESDLDAQAFASVNVEGQLHSDDNAIASELYHQYKVARRRWRRFSGRPPRRFRRVSNRPRDYSRLQKSPYARSFASFMPPSAFAGGKGKGKSSGKSGKTNPRGRDGKILKCSKCHSEQHLWRQCPLVAQGASAHLSQSVDPALALHYAPVPTVGFHGSASASDRSGLQSLPGVTFSSHYVSAVSGTVQTSLDQEMETLSYVSSNAGRNKRRHEGNSGPEPEPPTWEPGLPSSVRPDDSVSQLGSQVSRNQVEQLIPGAHPPLYPPPDIAPTRDVTDRTVGQRNNQNAGGSERQRATLQLQSLLYGTWWEASDGQHGVVEHSDACCFHQKTRVKGKVGLLIDPGAHDNLCGSLSMDLMSKQLKSQVTQKALHKPLSVQGVGNGSQEAGYSQEVKFHVESETADAVTGSFVSPIVENSELPPLLGLKSLRRCQAILDTQNQKLILPGPGGIEMKMSPGTLVLPLEMSESGHLILPLHPLHDMKSSQDSRTRNLEFISSRVEAKTEASDPAKHSMSSTVRRS